MRNLILTFCLMLFSNLLLGQENFVESIYFETDASQITTDGTLQLDKLIRRIKRKDIQIISIVGHTDNEGSDAYNDQLSKQRAYNVTTFLKSNLSEWSAVQIDYKGELLPIQPNISAHNKQLNRRVEVHYIKNSFHLPNGFDVPFQSFKVNADRDTILVVNAKGTRIHVPKHAFVCGGNNINGKPVDLMFREYTNAAEMAFSGINMTYKENNQEQYFNSAGMFEIQGSCNGQALELCKDKSIKVDYAIAHQVKDMAFYSLNKTNNEWLKAQEIQPKKLVKKLARRKRRIRHGHFIDKRCPLRIIFSKNQPMQVQSIKRNDTVKFHGDAKGKNLDFGNNANDRSGTLLASGADVGHTYPDIIEGLNVPSFGVYNCDQIYQLPRVVQVKAKYKDENGKEIVNPYLVSLIDLDFNGAFSFDANNFRCNPNGKNALAMFTTTGDLYLLDVAGFSSLGVKANGDYTFTVTRANDKVKNSTDLANYFGIKI
jgi:hypothetical protein